MKKYLLYAVGLVIGFLALVGFNYLQAQKNLKATKTSVLDIIFVGDPISSTSVNTPINVKWRVTAPNSFTTPTTTIYWGYDSSPSALTKFDSPLAVGYPNAAPDYIGGRFTLPDNFDLNLSFPKVGTVFYRAFAQVGNNYLWTPERTIVVK